MGFLEHMNGQVLNAHEKADEAMRMLDEQGRHLSRIVDIAETVSNRTSAQRVPFVMDVDATGVGRAILQVPQGIAWDMISFAAIGTAAGNFSIYMGSEDGTGLLFTKSFVVGTNLRLSDVFAGEEYVPQGAQVVIVAEGQTVGSQVRGNLKVVVQAEGNAAMKH